MKIRIVILIVILMAGASVQAQQTYMAIGDSLAFGFQQDKFVSELLSGTYDPANFNTGYVDVFGSILRNSLPNLKTVNFSCPGETTITLAVGGCPFHNSLIALPLHQSYPGSTPQLRAAVDYLQAHPGEVLLITLTIGANDLLNVISGCNRDATCVQAALPALMDNAGSALETEIVILKTVSPQSLVLYTNVPNPYLYSNPDLDPSFVSFNLRMLAKATNVGAKVVDWADVEKQYDSATFCLLSFVCTPPTYDIHPTDLGYRLLGYHTALALQ